MPIVDDVSREMTTALKSKHADRLAALRNIRAALLVEMKKDNSKTLSDEVSVGVLRRLEKQRRESIEAFEQAGREERAAAERAELGVVQEFLPKLADEAKTRAWVEEAIVAAGASTPADVGKVMGAVMKAHKGELDGNLARRIASELLGG